MIGNEIKTVSNLFHKHQPDDNINPLQAIWHYTSIDGLMGITNQGKRTLHFRFTRSDCLNDTSEGEHIIELFRSVCSELCEQGDISASFWEITKTINVSPYHLISYPLPPIDDCTSYGMTDAAQCEAFICCFSLKEDSLDMWRYYSKGSGGYAIAFLSCIFEQQQDYPISEYNKDAIFYNMDSFRVIYDTAKKKNILRSLVKDAYDLYCILIDQNPDEIEEMKKIIGGILQSYQFRFKHECFASEQEYRFVCYRPTKKPKNLKNDLPEVHYRNQNGVLVPYIDIPVENAHILEVMISPLVESQNCESITHEFLTSRSFTHCNVRKSKLPIRF